MYDFRRHITTLCAALGLTLFSGAAHAWVESEVRSQVATIDVDRAGVAVVTQDLTLAVRGGPLPGIELAGVDLDAQPLPDATVSAASGSKAQLSPTPLLIEKRDDGTLRIDIDRDKGLRTGVYLFHFQYRTNLLARGLIRREGNEAEVRWVGPRFNQGIDSARALFRLPAGPMPPTLPSSDTSAGRIDDGDALGGVFVGNLHRLADKDELDIVRPHVSRCEPVVWRVRTSAKIFDALSPPLLAPRSALGAQSRGALGPSIVVQPRQRLAWWLCAALAGLAYALAVAGKWRIFSSLCRTREATPRALVRLPVGPRAAASGTALAAAFVSAAWFDQATLGAALLILAMALAVHYALPPKIVLRGPGQWLPISESEAFARVCERSPGRFLDAGTGPGIAVFGLLCVSFGVGASLLFARAPYQALLLLLAAPCLLPLFFTGRAAQLPADPATRPRAVLASISKKLRRGGLKVVPWARIPERSREADELRLLVQLQGALRGLVSVELGVEYSAGVSGSGAALFVLVRAREGSLAIAALPPDVVWARGRKAEERAAVLRPRLPTQAQCVDLVLELARLLREEDPSQARRANSSRGTPAKPARVVSPAHVI